MLKTLVVVESPKKGKEIQKYLGDNYIVRASAGHCIDLAQEGKNKIGINVEKDFTPHYAIIPDKKDKLDAILRTAKEVDQVYLASDPDREGEAIAWHIASHIKNIDIPIKRVLFHEITKKGILKGIENPLDIDQHLFEAQQSRRVLDRLVGFMVSPFLMNKIGKKDEKVSAGRVQSIAVRMIVDKEREIESFKPEEYWSINAFFIKNDQKFSAKYQKKVTDKQTAQSIKSDLIKDTFQIIEIIAEEKVKPAPPPLETATLQQAANRKYGLNSADTMKAAQSLYESGFVTYIRTDSTRAAPEALEAARTWLTENNYKIPSNAIIYAAKNNAQDAHECIRPTDINKTFDKLGFLPEAEKKVYQLIRDRFLASQMCPALFDTVTVTVKSSSDHILKSYGRVLKFKGWMELLGEVKEKGDDAKALPILENNEILELTDPKIKAEQLFTKAPSRYRPDTLIGELKKKGIGRPSTYATILQKLTDRNYVKQTKDSYFATDLGKRVVDVLVKYFDFMKYEYTADMEDQLDQVAEGKISYLNMMNSFFPNFRDQLYKADSENNKDYGYTCYKCENKMWLKHGKFGYFLMCSAFPNCKNSMSCEVINGEPVLKDDNLQIAVGQSCPKCNGNMTLKDGKYGKYYSCLNYKECKGTKRVITGIKCLGCNDDTYVRVFDDGTVKLACMSYPTCRKLDDPPEEFLKSWISPKSINNNIPTSNVKVKSLLKPSRDKEKIEQGLKR